MTDSTGTPGRGDKKTRPGNQLGGLGGGQCPAGAQSTANDPRNTQTTPARQHSKCNAAGRRGRLGPPARVASARHRKEACPAHRGGLGRRANCLWLFPGRPTRRQARAQGAAVLAPLPARGPAAACTGASRSGRAPASAHGALSQAVWLGEGGAGPGGPGIPPPGLRVPSPGGLCGREQIPRPIMRKATRKLLKPISQTISPPGRNHGLA